MSTVEQERYERYLVNLHREKNILNTAKEEGKLEKAKETACKLKKSGKFTNQEIADIVELPLSVIESLDC